MEFLRSIFQPGEVFEVRVLGATRPGWRSPHTESGYFDYEHIPQISECLSELAGYAGAYVTLNPCNPDLLARAKYRLTSPQRNQTTSDGDILRRHWLFVDIDPVRPSGISATNAEKLGVLETMARLQDILTSRGWPEPIEVDSGNGFYLLYSIELPVNDDGLVHRCLQACSSLVGSQEVHVDTSVANAARIARIPGTWNRKGDNIPDRPHRQAKVIRIPDTLAVVPREMLEALASAVPAPAPKHAHTPAPGETAKPGDIFNARGDLKSLLLDHGWQLITESEGNQQWRRPGKESGNHSATWNGEVFYVFSSAAQPFEANKGYSAFGVYALLEHQGDHKAAAQALARNGYKDPEATWPHYPGVDLNQFLGQFEIQMPREPEPEPQDQAFPEHLLCPPGFMGDVIRYNLETAHKPQPILALAGALALQAILCSRKVKSITGCRPNIMVCGVAESGAGKEHARSLNRRILVESDLGYLHAEGVKSGSGLVNALTAFPAILFQLDEYGRFLQALRNPQKNPYAYEIITKLLTLYSSSGSLYESDKQADKDKGGKQILEPHVIIHGTTVPKSLYEGLTEESVTDGFLARTLIFDVAGHHPLRRILPESPIPGAILERAKWWGTFMPGQGDEKKRVNPDPLIVPVTTAADKIENDFTLQEVQEIRAMGDSPMRTLWTRTAENARKLALLYAVSANHEQPVIDQEATRWGYDLAIHLTRRMIDLVGENVASSQFHGEVLKIKKILKAGGRMDRNSLIRKAKIRSRDLDEILTYLIESQTVQIEEIATGGRKRIEYTLS